MSRAGRITFVVAMLVGLAAAFYFTQVRAPYTLWAPEQGHQHGSIVKAANGYDYSKLERARGIRDNKCSVWDQTPLNRSKAAAACVSKSGAYLYVIDENGGRWGGTHAFCGCNLRSHTTGSGIYDPVVGPLRGRGATSKHLR